MANEIENPFSNYGSIISGDRFIGREIGLGKINDTVFNENFGNLAVIGLPRVGKSSLVWHGIMDKKPELLKEHTIPVFIYFSTYEDSISVFKAIVSEIHSTIKFNELNTDNYKKSCEPIFKSILESNDRFDFITSLNEYFKTLKILKYKVIVIIDEFDKANKIFTDEDFQTLRELSYVPDRKICIVTTSRKSIKEIQHQVGESSNYDGICEKYYLGMFDEDDMDEFWDRYEDCLKADDEYKFLVKYYAGNHPWLLDFISHEMYSLKENNSNIYHKFQSFNLEFMKMLDSMAKVLKEEDLLETAIQYVSGPLMKDNKDKLQKLIQYDFVKETSYDYKNNLFDGIQIGPKFGENEDKAYICFSQFMTLDLHYRYHCDIPYLTLWGETENRLRYLIKDFLKIKYCEDVDQALEMLKNDISKNKPYAKFDYNKWVENIEHLKKNKKTLKKYWVEISSDKDKTNIINFTSTSQLFDIFIGPCWTMWFGEQVFKSENKENSKIKLHEWMDKIKYLESIRNPIDHNNPGILSEEQIEKARGYCEEIKAIVVEYQKSKHK